MSYSVAWRLEQVKLCGKACDRREHCRGSQARVFGSWQGGVQSTTLCCKEATYGLSEECANRGPHLSTGGDPVTGSPRCLGATCHICSTTVYFRNGAEVCETPYASSAIIMEIFLNAGPCNNV